MASLSVLELFILVAAQRLSRRRDRAEGFNFEMVWEEYSRLGQLRAHADNYCKPAALRAWEQLHAFAMLTNVDPRCGVSEGVLSMSGAVSEFIIRSFAIEGATEVETGSSQPRSSKPCLSQFLTWQKALSRPV